MSSQAFQVFFENATNRTPYPYQASLASSPIENRLIHVPTGCGKTAAVILSWLWQRRMNPNGTPRRLVYCLPVKQAFPTWEHQRLDDIWDEVNHLKHVAAGVFNSRTIKPEGAKAAIVELLDLFELWVAVGHQ
jgi:hypothetical protein